MEDESRRTFLKVAGAAAAVGIGAPVVGAFASGAGQEEVQEGATHWAMVIDIKKCLQADGCTKCTEACHQQHNVPDMSAARYNLPPEEVTKREIHWIWKAEYENAFPEQQQQYTRPLVANKPVLVLCNHCQSPPCVRVCPTGATWKRDTDGIVMMDMHRCIGCRYCVVGCPYGARSFNWMEPWPRPFEKFGTPPNLDFTTRTKGVVEKCNFCADLLAKAVREGRQDYTPACVAACPNGAMAFGNIHDEHSVVRRLLSQHHAIRRKPALGTEPQVYYLV